MRIKWRRITRGHWQAYVNGRLAGSVRWGTYADGELGWDGFTFIRPSGGRCVTRGRAFFITRHRVEERIRREVRPA